MASDFSAPSLIQLVDSSALLVESFLESIDFSLVFSDMRFGRMLPPLGKSLGDIGYNFEISGELRVGDSIVKINR